MFSHKQSATDAKSEKSPDAKLLEHVSVSHLLGRDYVFLDTHYEKNAFSSPEKIISTITYLVTELNLLDHNTLFIEVNSESEENPVFSRQEITWKLHTIASLETMPVSSSEQQDFMKMIWQCSTCAVG